MAINLAVNGVGYAFPQTGDSLWGDAVTGWATAVTSGMLQKAGGNFTLTANVNFGNSFGLLSKYFTSVTANAATAGAVRMAKSDTVAWRNNANTGNVLLGLNSSDQIVINGVPIGEDSVFNVLAFGAVADGSTDCTTAFQNAVTAAQNAGGAVYVPPGVSGYMITNTVTVGNDCAIIGDSMTASSSAVNGSTVFFAGTNAVPMFLIDDNAGSFRMSGLSLKNTGSCTVAVQINRVNTLIENCCSNSGTGFSTAIFSTYQSNGNYSYHVTIRNCYLANQSISSQTPIGIYYEGGHTLCVDNTMLSGFSDSGIKCVPSSTHGGTEGISIISSHVECFAGINVGYPGSSNAVGINIVGTFSPQGVNIQGTNFQMNGEQISAGANQRGITIGKCFGCFISGCHFDGGSGAGAISITDSSALGIVIMANDFNQFGVVSIEDLTSAGADYAIYKNSFSGGSVVPAIWFSKISLFNSISMQNSVIGGMTAQSHMALFTTGNITSGNTTQYGHYINSTFGSGATAAGYGHSVALSSAATSFTMALMSDYYAQSPSIGSGSTVTRFINFRADQVTGGISNTAVLADGVAFTGVWFINQAGTSASTFGGKVTVASFNVSGLTATTVLYLDSSKNLTSSAVTPTQLGYLSGATGTTGTGTLVYSIAPTFTGIAAFAALSSTGNATLCSTSGILAVGSANNLYVPAGASPNVGIGTTSPNAAGFNSHWGVLSILGNGTAGQGAGAIEIGATTASSTPGDYVMQFRMNNGANLVGFMRCVTGSNANAGAFIIQTANSSGTMATGLNIDQNGFQNTQSAWESTGATSCLLGTNSPAGTGTAPYKWIKQISNDGSTVYYPVWK